MGCARSRGCATAFTSACPLNGLPSTEARLFSFLTSCFLVAKGPEARYDVGFGIEPMWVAFTKDPAGASRIPRLPRCAMCNGGDDPSRHQSQVGGNIFLRTLRVFHETVRLQSIRKASASLAGRPCCAIRNTGDEAFTLRPPRAELSSYRPMMIRGMRRRGRRSTQFSRRDTITGAIT